MSAELTFSFLYIWQRYCKKKFSLSEAPILIPEFPVQYGLIPKSKGSAEENQSFKIDYLALTKDGRHAYFVELKTDLGSRRTSQDQKMIEAADLPLSNLFQGIECLHKKSIHKRKYLSLYTYIGALLDLEKRSDGIIDRATFEKFNLKPKIVYIQPSHSDNSEVIDFKEFVELIKAEPTDPLYKRFAESLGYWQT
ncbi:MAG: hypothetical protein KAZ14_00810 [Nitrosomonas sp.]|nr:hypothetical protein [Nitrosomonas sp.]